MEYHRRSGVLLHPTSIPGPYGIGELGSEARRFVDFLERAGQSLWQILPLGPTGYGDSPYASFSSFAGNPLLISIEKLLEEGILDSESLGEVPPFPIDKVDFGWVIHWKIPVLLQAAEHFLDSAPPARAKEFKAFTKNEASWLDDYSLFMAVKNTFDAKAQQEGVHGAMWSNYWPKDIALRKPKAVEKWRNDIAREIDIQKVWQFFFYEQWLDLKAYANEKGISLIGDLPVFVASDSADVWSDRKYFQLDENGRPTSVAGVPPDYFSETGQLWGNPLYDWDALKADEYDWWLKRIEGNLRLVDILRIDHFRGFEAFWSVPAGEETAVNGEWKKAPGMDLFKTLRAKHGEMPIIAEDLGVITPEVEELRDAFGFPGMKILQFAFDAKESGGINADNQFLPHNYVRDCVVYTGTHDNDTTLGWYLSAEDGDRDLVRRYLARDDHDIVWEFIRLATASVAAFSVIPFQDLLGLGSDTRMNTPSTLGGNWEWRYRTEATNDWVAHRFKDMCFLYGRH